MFGGRDSRLPVGRFGARSGETGGGADADDRHLGVRGELEEVGLAFKVQVVERRRDEERPVHALPSSEEKKNRYRGIKRRRRR